MCLPSQDQPFLVPQVIPFFFQGCIRGILKFRNKLKGAVSHAQDPSAQNLSLRVILSMDVKDEVR